jgi:hypothetical protein
VVSTPSRGWARHFQDDWQARAGDPRLPYWLRVAALAYGSHTDNGHARFRRGEVALILGHVDTSTGVVRPFTNVRREIARAVEYGWLAEGSYWGCLIVPAHSIRKGDFTKKPKPCPLAPGHAKRANRSPSERNDSLTSTPSERFEARSAQSVNGSEREPLCSVLSPNHDERTADIVPLPKAAS